MENSEGHAINAGIKVRPGARDFIRRMHGHFEVGVFTASQKEYAQQVIRVLDPLGELFDFQFYRDNCLCTEKGVFVKDLRIFKDRAMSDLIMVDNSSYVFGLNVDNGVPVLPFYDAPSDRQLDLLLPYLLSLVHLDVRSTNRNTF